MTNKLPNKTITMENIEEIYEYIFAPYVKQLKLSFLEIEAKDKYALTKFSSIFKHFLKHLLKNVLKSRYP